MKPLLLFLSLASIEPSDFTFTSKRYGFSIERPSEDWGFYSTESVEGALFAASFYPRGSSGVPNITVYVERTKSSEAYFWRDATLHAFEVKEGCEVAAETIRIAEHDHPALAGEIRSESGDQLGMRYAYVAREPYLYTLTGHWRADDESAQRAVDAALRSFALFDPDSDDETEDSARWRKLAARCGSEITWAATWKEAAERATKEHKLIFIVYESYPALDLPQTAASGPLMDPDLVRFLSLGFIALRMDADTEAPFRDPRAFGLSEHSWGGAFLFATPDGKIARETGIGDASHLLDVARDVCVPVLRAKPVGNAFERGLGHLTNGEFEKALEVLEPENSARGHRLRARILRQLRRGADALKALSAARRVGGDELEPELVVDEAVLHMRMGDYTEAQAGFERAVSEHPDSERAREAMFWLGTLEYLNEGAEEGTGWWRRLVESHPDDRWAWKAAANLLGRGSFVNGGERLEWPDAAVVASVARVESAPLGVRDLDRAARTARAYLVASQRTEGSWIAPSDAFGLGSNLYTPPITAICGASLLAAPQSLDERRAVERALAFTLATHAAGTLSAGSDLAGVYSIWGRAFALSFLCRCRAERVGDSAAIDAAISELTASIEASQHSGGGWPYVYFPGDPEGVGFDPSASFLTAGVVLALVDARAAKAKVSDESLAKALRFLDAMRMADGSYRYMPDMVEEAGTEAHPEAAGRGPLCALALLRGGACGVDRVREALVLFVKHQRGLQKEWHKELCHTGSEGQGSHYLFYDYRFAAEAVRELPRDERAPFREAVLRDVLAARFTDGSFEDMPGLGRAYGTAMAIFAMRALRDE